jgi:hypothetical protein
MVREKLTNAVVSYLLQYRLGIAVRSLSDFSVEGPTGGQYIGKRLSKGMRVNTTSLPFRGTDGEEREPLRLTLHPKRQ